MALATNLRKADEEDNWRKNGVRRRSSTEVSTRGKKEEGKYKLINQVLASFGICAVCLLFVLRKAKNKYVLIM